VLAPAGDLHSLRAALQSGADAVYFGLDEGFNARARAENFSLETLPATVAMIHRAGARAYLTVNTLVFEPELPVVEKILRGVAASGVDALIVQDPAVALLAGAICPQLELHASTQMTVSSPEAGRFARSLGCTRVVVPRELSVDEIRRFAEGTDLELEVFIHGALCVAWSGQCLSSEAWGGRSANRGQCAQACRMPYDLIVDGTEHELDEVAYLLSPRDLAGLDVVGDLSALGVHGLKIEGRQKGPTYVAKAVGAYRHAVDAEADAGNGEVRTGAERAADVRAMALAYSRGFSNGFLRGSDHQTLVDGRFPKHRGLLLGQVIAVRGERVLVEGAADAPEMRPGMGVVFDAGHPEDPNEPGGPVFAVSQKGGAIELAFGTPGPDLARVAAGNRVWVTSDPAIRFVEGGEPEGRVGVDLQVRGKTGCPLEVYARVGMAEAGPRMGEFETVVCTQSMLEPARGGGLDEALLREKLGAFGGTPLRLNALDATGLERGLHVPVSELKALRRRIVDELVRQIERGYERTIVESPTLAQLRPALATTAADTSAIPSAPRIVPLCRTEAQLEAVIAAGLPEVELDWMELVGLARVVTRARTAGLRVTIATVRVQKPGEEGYDARIAQLAPDGVLVRHWGGLMHFAERGHDGLALHGDFSLNVTNSLTARHLLGLGLDSFTAAHDLDAVQLFALLEHVPAAQTTVVVHHHIPTFHTEHCVYAHLLSKGADFRTCGRPCEAHEVALRDRVGLVHPVVVDVGCRNTVFNAQAQSAASLVPKLLERGVRRFRIEFVRESRDEAACVLAAYSDLLAGRLAPAEAVRRAGVHEQFGVTRGTMKVLR
jgi:putative protease